MSTTPRRVSPAARNKALVRRLELAWRATGVVCGVLLVVLLVVLVTREDTRDGSLPNPMGGPVLAAPDATGAPVALGSLEVVAPHVAMGVVPLEVTVVPQWQVANPTDGAVALTVGQPRVHEGCCPGPVHVDGIEVPPGGSVTVAPGAEVTVQFPLQMHAGMDGPHHLSVPLQAGGAQAELHVTGDFRG